MKDAVFWDMTTPCDCCENQRFRGIYLLHFQGERVFEDGSGKFLRNVGKILPDFKVLMTKNDIFF
jgi:hypothetical protein